MARPRRSAHFSTPPVLRAVNRGRLVVVSVVRKPIEVVAAWPFVVAAPPSASPEECALAALRAAVEGLPMDVPVVTIVCHGRVGPVLLREAARHLCDEIVVGAPSGAWSRLTGGVARYLRSRAAVDGGRGTAGDRRRVGCCAAVRPRFAGVRPVALARHAGLSATARRGDVDGTHNAVRPSGESVYHMLGWSTERSCSPRCRRGGELEAVMSDDATRRRVTREAVAVA